MTLEQQVNFSKLQQKFRLKNAELQYIEAESEALEVKKNVLAIELEEIKIELILIKEEQNLDNAQNDKVDCSREFDTLPYLDLQLADIKNNSGEINLDFTNPTAIVTEPQKEPTEQMIVNIEKYLTESERS